MSKILLVDDDKIVLRVLSKVIGEKIKVPTDQVMNFKELEKVVLEIPIYFVFVIIIFQTLSMEKLSIFL